MACYPEAELLNNDAEIAWQDEIKQRLFRGGSAMEEFFFIMIQKC